MASVHNETSTIKRIVIVGGGTAGWLTAARLAHDHCCGDAAGISVTLIESPDVKTLGVGEGSWPTLRVTLKALGIKESDFMSACDVSLKQGSKFINWCRSNGNDAYYHPFSPPNIPADVDPAAAWYRLRHNVPYAFAVCAQTNLAEQGRAPKQASMPDYAAYTNYGYHLNAGKFAQFMRDYCVNVLKVDHQRWHIAEVSQHENGNISGLIGTQGEHASGDFFIDCSGMSRILMNRFDTACVDLSPYLFNDRAIAAQVPYANPNQAIATVTQSTAQADGWVWDIGLTERRGTGFVYSSRFTDDDQAQARLASYLQATGLKDPSTAMFRALHFTPSYLHKPWQHNCVAVGMSAGFVEPLEASAIAMIEICAKAISDDLPSHAPVMAAIAARFNRRFVRRWRSIADFLKLHYLLSQRTEPYWQAHQQADSVPQSLQAAMQLWQYHPPDAVDFEYSNELFGPASFQYVLYGMGFIPRQLSDPKVARRLKQQVDPSVFNEMDDTLRKGLRGLPQHRELLKQWTNHTAQLA